MPQNEWFRRAGPLLFGQRWQQRMARLLEVDRKTVERYANGTSPLPAERRTLIVTTMRVRVTELMEHLREEPQ